MFPSTPNFIFRVMDFNVKVYPCYFDENYMVSCTDKKKVNLRMEAKTLELLTDIQNRRTYLEKYWYNLKYYVHSLHAIYKLLYKMLTVYGNSSMKTRLKCHNLVDGPRTIKQNALLFQELIHFTQNQTQLLGAQICFDFSPKFQDTISRIFF